MNSRRSFFKTVFKTAGAGVAAMVLPTTALAQTERVGDKKYIQFNLQAGTVNIPIDQISLCAERGHFLLPLSARQVVYLQMIKSGKKSPNQIRDHQGLPPL
jgi:hypothetical protein